MKYDECVSVGIFQDDYIVGAKRAEICEYGRDGSHAIRLSEVDIESGNIFYEFKMHASSREGAISRLDNLSEALRW